jgi:hypothetical protein
MRILVRIILSALLVGVSSAQPAPGVSDAGVALPQKTETSGMHRRMRMGVAVLPSRAVIPNGM